MCAMAHARERGKIIIIIFLMRILFRVFSPFYSLYTRVVVKCRLLKKKYIYIFV